MLYRVAQGREKQVPEQRLAWIERSTPADPRNAFVILGILLEFEVYPLIKEHSLNHSEILL